MLAEAAPAGSAPAAPGPGPAPAPASGSSSSDSNQKRHETPEEREGRQLGRTWGWTLVSVGAAAGVVAIGTSYLMLNDASTRNSNCNSSTKVCNGSGFTANSQLADLAGWNTALWIVSAVGLGVGAYLLITHPTDRAVGNQIEVGVEPNAGGAGVGMRGTF